MARSVGRWRRPRTAPPTPAARENHLAVGTEGQGDGRESGRERWPDRPAGGGVPEPRRAVGAARQHRLAVGAEGHGNDREPLHERLADRPARRGVPDPCRPVGTASDDRRAIGAERRGMDLALMPEWLADRPAGVGVPGAATVVSALQVITTLSSGPNATARTAARCTSGCTDRPAGVGVPALDHPVRGSRDEGLAVGAEGHGNDGGAMRQRWSDRPAGVGVPELRRVRPSGRRLPRDGTCSAGRG